MALAEGAIWGGRGAHVRLLVGGIAGGRAVRREPVAARPDCPTRHVAALALLRARRGPACRSSVGTVGGDRLVIELAGRGATGAAEGRGSRVADALDVGLADLRHAWEHGLARALGRGGAGGRQPGSGLRCAASSGPSCPAGSDDGGGGGRRPRPVRPPAPGPGVGRPGGQRRRTADALQGPRDDQHGPRRAAPAEPARTPRDRPLPLFDDRLDGLGERPADAPPRPAPGDLASATTATSSTRASCSGSSGGGRSRLPASTDTELLTALLADEPAADTVEALLRVLPRVRGAYSLVILDERRVIGVRDPHGFRPLVLGRLPLAGGRRRRRAGPVGRRRSRRAGCSPRRRPASTSSGRSTSATSSRARSSSSSRAGRRARSASPSPARPVRVRAHLLCPARLVHGGPQPVRGRGARWAMQLALEHPVEADLVMPVPDTGAPAAAGYAEAVRDSRTARASSATATRAGRSSSPPRRCASGG